MVFIAAIFIWIALDGVADAINSRGAGEEVSKSSAAEKQFLRVLHERMADGSIRSVISVELAGELHHPLGGFREGAEGSRLVRHTPDTA